MDKIVGGQEDAIKKAEGPCIILAGAGTGKTYTIVEKIKYLINNNIYSPEKIVCITFSNEAANNLISRIEKALKFEENKRPIIKTFHSFSADLLRRHGDKIGIDKEFKVLTPDDAKVILHKYLKVPAGNCHKFINAIGTVKDLGIELNLLKNYLDKKIGNLNGIDLEKRLENLQFELKTMYLRADKWKKHEVNNEARRISQLLNLKKFVNAWNAYEKLKKLKNYQDYSDLNKSALRLVQENRDINKEFDYIIVDEFQDTNKIQLELLFYLVKNKNVSIVGDLNQSIYRFRGAYNRNFNEFKEKFNISNNEIFNLAKSYRSSNKILRAAHNLILNNYSNVEDCFEVLSFDNREGANIEVYELINSKEEARKIVELIEREVADGVDMREICVMFRTHQQGRIIKKTLELRKIPFVSVSNGSLLKEKSVRTVIDYLSILEKLKKNKSGGEQAWWDLVYQLNFDDSDLINIGRFIKENNKAENLCRLMLSSLPDLELSQNGKMVAKILVEKIKLLEADSDKEVAELVRNIYNLSGLIHGENVKEKNAIIMNLNRFYDLIKGHSVLHGDELSGFINYLDIVENLGIEIERADSENDGVRLMTLHAVKGLEYKVVIVTNLSQKRFPMEKININSLIPVELLPEFKFSSNEDVDYYVYEYEKKNQLFEERRLCYVAFTRAKEKLILTYAQEYGGKKHFPSQFLDEIRYKENPDFSFFADLELKYYEPENSQKIEFATALGHSNFDSIIHSIIKESNRNEKFVQKEISFSPSALLMFVECQKKYEYKYIYNMPEKKTISWEMLLLGSFVHKILEAGVKKNFKTLKDFEDLAREMHLEEDWESVELDDALHLIRVFFERNKNKYNSDSKTEQSLKMQLAELNFIGFADRIDFSDDGLEIVDYKTGKSNIPVLARNWQLGYYALAAANLGKVKRLTLDMLRNDMPLEFELDDKGNAAALNSNRVEGFNIYNVEQELIKTAHSILSAYKVGFKPCSVEKNCAFCNEYVYGF